MKALRSSLPSALTTSLATFALPLVGSPLLATPAPWLGVFAGTLLLASQPSPDRRAMWSRESRDRHSALAIFASMIATQLVAVVEYRAAGGLLPVSAPARLATGIALVAAGFMIRLWAIRTLGEYFTATVEIAAHQRVVRTGPYALVRHPSYSGALLVAMGMVCLLGSGTGLALLALAVIPSYFHRVRVEERALVGDLGAAYIAYREQVPAFAPKPFGRVLPAPR